MLTLAQFQHDLQALLGKTAREAGRKSTFIQRQRKLKGETFVSSLVWEWMANQQPTLTELSQSAALCGVNISPAIGATSWRRV